MRWRRRCPPNWQAEGISEAAAFAADAKKSIHKPTSADFAEVSSAAELKQPARTFLEIESLEANRMLYPMQAIPSNLDPHQTGHRCKHLEICAETSVAVLDTGVCYKNTSPSPGYCASGEFDRNSIRVRHLRRSERQLIAIALALLPPMMGNLATAGMGRMLQQ